MKPSTHIELNGGRLLGAPVAPHQVTAARLRVLAYDIGDPRRSARVRRLVARWSAGDGQYSVRELQMGRADLHALVDAVHSRLDPSQDRLAVWQPARQLAWRFRAGDGGSAQGPWPQFRVWVLAYDITDEARLGRVQRAVASHGFALQRSVYVLHSTGKEAAQLTAGLLPQLDEGDRLTLWPLKTAGHLWSLQPIPPACIAIGTADAEIKSSRAATPPMDRPHG